MARNVCINIEEIRGTKSTKIMELINRKLHEQKLKMYPKHIKDNSLDTLYKDYTILKEKCKSVRDQLEKRKEQLNLEWDYHSKEYYLKQMCRISKEDFDLLQQAQDFYSIGNRNKANEIWTAMIKKHKLFES